jgi:hypothetical protein
MADESVYQSNAEYTPALDVNKNLPLATAVVTRHSIACSRLKRIEQPAMEFWQQAAYTKAAAGCRSPRRIKDLSLRSDRRNFIRN